MTSLKQKGNEAFRRQRYRQAIKYYDEYVREQHHDNKNAFFNLGLCFSKLKQHEKSIEACKSAIALDPSYQKGYYRLMKEYLQIGNAYQVFINARNYLRTEKDQSSAQLGEAKELLKQFKTRFVNKSYKIIENRAIHAKDQLFSLIEPLKPLPQKDPSFNEQIDKYPQEWLDEWAQDIQSEDAKWQQIAYIIKEVDYHYGISLAYFYLNHITTQSKRKQVTDKINQIQSELNVQRGPSEDRLDKQDLSETTHFESINHPLDSLEGQFQSSPYIHPAPQRTKQTEKQNIALQQQQSIINDNVPIQRPLQTPKIQDLLYRKAQNRKINQKSQIVDGDHQSHKTAQYPIKAGQTRNQSGKTPTSSKQTQKSEQSIQQMYGSYCGSLSQKTSDLFVQLYKSIFTILRGEEPAVIKGKLLILIKKRTNKFKLIVSSFSDNQQKAILDLLVKNRIEQYAVDFAPKYYNL